MGYGVMPTTLWLMTPFTITLREAGAAAADRGPPADELLDALRGALARRPGEAQTDEDGAEAPAVPPLALDTLRAAVERCPVEEIDCYEMVMIGKTQQEVAQIFGVSQSAVSFRLQRLHTRLRWLLLEAGSWFTHEQLGAALKDLLTDQDVACLECLWETTNQRELSRRRLIRAYVNQSITEFVTRLFVKFDRTCLEHPELDLYARGFRVLRGVPSGKTTRGIGARWGILARYAKEGTRKGPRPGIPRPWSQLWLPSVAM